MTDQMDQVELLGKEWSIKEGQYKTELKKLEVCELSVLLYVCYRVKSSKSYLNPLC